MSEPYHPSEEVDECIDLAGNIQEEMRLYPTEAEFRLSLQGLRNLYSSSATLEMIDHFANITGNLYARFVEREQEAYRWIGMFAAGGLLGLHVSTYDLPDKLPTLIRSVADPEIDEMTLTDNENIASALEILADLEEMQTDEFETGDSEIIQAAAQLYSMDSDASEQYMFAMGYRFAVSKIIEFTSYFDDFDFLILDYVDAEKQASLESGQLPS